MAEPSTTDADALMSAYLDKQLAPGLVAAFEARGWPLPACIDRVYVSDKAKQLIGYAPHFGWRAVTDAHPPA